MLNACLEKGIPCVADPRHAVILLQALYEKDAPQGGEAAFTKSRAFDGGCRDQTREEKYVHIVLVRGRLPYLRLHCGKALHASEPRE